MIDDYIHIASIIPYHLSLAFSVLEKHQLSSFVYSKSNTNKTAGMVPCLGDYIGNIGSNRFAATIM